MTHDDDATRERLTEVLVEAGFTVKEQTERTTFLQWTDAPRGITTVTLTEEDGSKVLRTTMNGRIEYRIELTADVPVGLVRTIACGK